MEQIPETTSPLPEAIERPEWFRSHSPVALTSNSTPSGSVWERHQEQLVGFERLYNNLIPDSRLVAYDFPRPVVPKNSLLDDPD